MPSEKKENAIGPMRTRKGWKVPFRLGRLLQWFRSKLGKSRKIKSAVFDQSNLNMQVERGSSNSLCDPRSKKFINWPQKKQQLVKQSLVTEEDQVLYSLMDLIEYIEYISNVQESWQKRLLQEKQLLKDFLLLKVKGGVPEMLPENISSAHMIDWLIYRGRSTFRNITKTYGKPSSNPIYADLVWELNQRIQLEELKEEVLQTLSADDQEKVIILDQDSNPPGCVGARPGSSVLVLPFTNWNQRNMSTDGAESVLMMVDDLQMLINRIKATILEKVQEDVVPALLDFVQLTPTTSVNLQDSGSTQNASWECTTLESSRISPDSQSDPESSVSVSSSESLKITTVFMSEEIVVLKALNSLMTLLKQMQSESPINQVTSGEFVLSGEIKSQGITTDNAAEVLQAEQISGDIFRPTLEKINRLLTSSGFLSSESGPSILSKSINSDSHSSPCTCFHPLHKAKTFFINTLVGIQRKLSAQEPSVSSVSSVNSDDIRDMISGILKQIQESSSLPGSSCSCFNKKQGRRISACLSKKDKTDLGITIRQIFNMYDRNKDQEETVECLSISLSDALCEHLQTKCQPEISKVKKYTSSQVECILPCTSMASSDLQVVSYPLTESVLNLLEVTFGNKVMNLELAYKPAVDPNLKKLLVQSHSNNSDLNNVEELSTEERGLQKTFQATDNSSNSSGSTDQDKLLDSCNQILEKVVKKTVLKVLMEEFSVSKSIFNEEILSNQESIRSLSPRIQLILWLQVLIVRKILEHPFPTQTETDDDAENDSIPSFQSIIMTDGRDEHNTAADCSDDLGATEASAERTPTHTPACTEVKKSNQVSTFFRRTWKSLKRTFTKRSNKIYPA
ncbi:uncharacterized protein LOC134318732 [Trichomycterus rosablanca]|uniref:uncharacterized protein LOC134318732 n=1 Tax=Trichomycterus rosablanca TaxID=2290929 RepID=UPI002F358531